jgi:two-component system sensor histidine kinase/response regulator
MKMNGINESYAAKPSILIVDDTPDNVAVLAEHLVNHGFSAMVAQDGDEGIERAQFGKPDLILLDVVMPGMDGFETCRRLKAHAATREIPVIFMTALADIGDKITAYKMGGVDYVTKPFHIDEVLARINTHLTLQAMRRQLVEQNLQLQQEITERKRAEAVLAQRSQELVRSNAELEQMAYVASHDLQEPLRMVTSYLQLLAQRYGHLLDADAHDFIDFAVDGAKRMQALIDDLLSYSRVGTRFKPLVPTDCGAVLEIALRSLRVAIADSGAQIDCEPLPEVLGDANQLTQLFQNLIANAIKFRGAQAPQITVRAARDPGGWRFEVRDNGIGIAPDYFERIFVMFQRLHSRSTYEGTGIGLAICKKIVERHGGHIWVESAPGQGAVFKFILPGTTADGETRHASGSID